MKNIARKLVSVGLALCATVAHADLVVDQRYNGSHANVDEVTFEEWKALVEPFYKRWEQQLRRAIAADNEGIAPTHSLGGRHTGHILWNGKHYYGWAVEYLSAAQYREIRASILEKGKGKTLPGGGVCALYVFDEDLNKLASLKIDLPENNHGTWCNGIYGFGGAGNGIDGVLVAISYYLTGRKPAQRPQDIGKGWRYMTVLIRFVEQDGKLVLIQDDTCLGNPNTYDTIPAARKALRRCALRQAQSAGR